VEVVEAFYDVVVSSEDYQIEARWALAKKNLSGDVIDHLFGYPKGYSMN
jgi:hypothetical protein